METFHKLVIALLFHSHFVKLNQSVFWSRDDTSAKFSVYSLLEIWLVPMKWGWEHRWEQRD